MLSHIIEVRKFLDKNLLCDIQVAAELYELFDRVIETNKWLRFEEWIEFYEKLDKILALYTSSSSNLKELGSKVFSLSNNVEVHIETYPLEKTYLDIFSLSEDEVIPIRLSIKVNRINVCELNKKVAEMEKYKRKLQKCQCSSSVKIRIRKDQCREYDPVQESGGGTGNIPFYKPYKPSSKIDLPLGRTEYRLEKSEYTPKPIGNTSENYKIRAEGSKLGNQSVPQYIPSEIKSFSDGKDEILETSLTSDSVSQGSTKKNKWGSRQHSLRSAKKRHYSNESGETAVDQDFFESNSQEVGRETRSKKRRCDADDKEKRRLSQDLFGSDDSDQEDDLNVKSNIFIKSPNKSSEIKIKLEEDQTYKKSKKDKRIKTEWTGDDLKDSKSKRLDKIHLKIDDKKRKEASDEDNKQTSKENGKKKSKKLQPSQEITPPQPKFTEEDQQRNRENHEKEMEVLKTYKEEIQALKKSTPTIEIIKLDHLGLEELLATFDEFKPILDKHFRDYKKQKTHVVKEMEDMNHLLIMSIIDENTLLPLMKLLKSHYEADMEKNVPCYTDLFMTLMLPEWILNIFMKEHKLTRNEAIERIKTQNQLETSSSSIY